MMSWAERITKAERVVIPEEAEGMVEDAMPPGVELPRSLAIAAAVRAAASVAARRAERRVPYTEDCTSLSRSFISSLLHAQKEHHVSAKS